MNMQRARREFCWVKKPTFRLIFRLLGFPVETNIDVDSKTNVNVGVCFGFGFWENRDIGFVYRLSTTLNILLFSVAYAE